MFFPLAEFGCLLLVGSGVMVRPKFVKNVQKHQNMVLYHDLTASQRHKYEHTVIRHECSSLWCTKWISTPPWPYAAFSPPPETQHHQHPKDIQLSTTTIDTAVTNSSDAMLLATVLWTNKLTRTLESQHDVTDRLYGMRHCPSFIRRWWSHWLFIKERVSSIHTEKSTGHFASRLQRIFIRCIDSGAFVCSSVRVTRLHFRMCGLILAVHINWMGWIWMK